MNRRRKRWLLRNAKMFAVCGAMVYMVSGLMELTSNAVEAKNCLEAAAPMFLEAQRENLKWEKPAEITYQPSITSIDLDAEETYLLAKIAMAEAEGEDTEGKALVIMVVLNRVWSNRFPNSVEEVIMQKNQFSVTQEGGRWWKVEPNEDCYKALDMIVAEQWDESHVKLSVFSLKYLLTPKTQVLRYEYDK